MERLDKQVSQRGGLTRSAAREAIKAGRVTVDGIAVRDGSQKVSPEQRICLEGRALAPEGRLVVMLNKPAGFVTATEDRQERTVMELLPPELADRGLKPVGRLDKQTEGLLLLTNDGALLHRLIAPRSRVAKVYYARHAGTAVQADAEAFAAGLTLADGTVCLPARLESLGPGESRVTVYEGKYHQVRRMLAARGLRVDYLERLQEGELTLEGLPRGQTRMLTPEEIALLEKEFVHFAEENQQNHNQLPGK